MIIMPIYNIENDKLTPIKQVKFNEMELQKLTEKNLEELFSLKFVASDFQVDNLRIDTLAFNEETKSFVIIKYNNYNVSDYGHSYLSLMSNNKAEFVLKYNLVFSKILSKEDFDFSQSVVMFISPKYTHYQLKSVESLNSEFELWEAIKFSNGTVLFDKINDIDDADSIMQITEENTENEEIKNYTEEYTLSGKSEYVETLYYNLKDFVLFNYKNIEIKHLKHYYSFRVNDAIVASAELLSNSIKTWINLKDSEIKDPGNRVRDVSDIGHLGIGKYEFKIKSEDDFDYFNRLFRQSYEEKIREEDK